MFVSMITALLATEAFLALRKVDKLRIKISGNVPPAIIESFNDMLVIVVIELAASLISFTCVSVSGM